jgi:hypothetical protein
MGSNHEENKQLLKKLINLQGYENFIAGGGIWPEPYAFDPTKKRSSYFFGRNKNGQLDFYDDYNNPDGEGYHHEEWYIPTTYLEEGQAYWSKSYIDPYSFQPMVTVSVPMYKEKKFIGVSTVDIMLDGLQSFLKTNMEELNGYAFIVDRNNKFLSFPKFKNMKIDKDYITLDTFSEQEKSYTGLNSLINNLNQIQLNEKYEKIAKELEKNSEQIDQKEAKKIAMLLYHESNHYNMIHQNDIAIVKIDEDPLLQIETLAVVLRQKNTHWSLVIVIPADAILAQSNKIFFIIPTSTYQFFIYLRYECCYRT